ncbi:hypothetical protein GOP47_0003916 [Adiantum capillus-veneris]|uniref:Uncharacterized protein n=1 Tax=Adiantum capillus-veneris TaxID=13818 RepID=A0A9D4V7T4_ADICA|nr:hypothetical protein GOP47_0003916 [Adiantum capillus-veneris]
MATGRKQRNYERLKLKQSLERFCSRSRRRKRRGTLLATPDGANSMGVRYGAILATHGSWTRAGLQIYEGCDPLQSTCKVS